MRTTTWLIAIGLITAACGSVTGQDPDASTTPTADAAVNTTDGGDTTPPETTIDSGPDAIVNATMAEFTFSSSEPNSTFQCRLGAAPFSNCTSPHQVVVGEGDQTFEVIATDASGNADPTAAQHQWTVDLTNPTITLNGPASPTPDTNATLTFSADEAVSFECDIDGGGYISCTSPVSYMSLAPSTMHTFSVRATDAAGNQATETHQWTIQDPCSPYLVEAEDSSQVIQSAGWSVFSGGVLHNGQGLGTTSSDSNASVSLDFYGNGLTVYYENGPNRGKFTVSIDGTVLATIDGNAADFNFQVPAVIATNLALGDHTMVLQCVSGTGYCSPDYFGITCN